MGLRARAPALTRICVNESGPMSPPQVQEVEAKKLGGVWKVWIPRVLSCLSVTEDALLAFPLFPKTMQINELYTQGVLTVNGEGYREQWSLINRAGRGLHYLTSPVC